MDPIVARELTKVFTTKEGRPFRKQHKTITAVDRMSFSVKRGEVVGLLGPNGAGKTTTIRLLSTLLEPTSGEAYINGYSITKDSQEVRQSLGVMLTGERTLYWKLTGRENLEYFGALYHMGREHAKKRAEYLLDLVGLKERADTLVEDYSSGMRIRLSFGRALMHEAPVLMFDEPTMSLDPQSARLIRQIISDLRNAGQAIILTTHNMEEADQLSDRVAIIDHGRIVVLDSPEELKSRLRRKELIEVEVKSPSDHLVSQLKALEGVAEASLVHSANGEGSATVRVQTYSGTDVLPQVMATILKSGSRPMSVKFDEPTLEDVFIELTGKALRD